MIFVSVARLAATVAPSRSRRQTSSGSQHASSLCTILFPTTPERRTTVGGIARIIKVGATPCTNGLQLKVQQRAHA